MSLGRLEAHFGGLIAQAWLMSFADEHYLL